MKCKICNADSLFFDKGEILNKYKIDYFQCSHCNFVQTEEPFWLEEAYSDAIAASDVGLVYRNLILSKMSGNIILDLFNHEANFLDYGGGYGLFVRLMRDAGFNFYWHDKFCQNLFAKGFEVERQAEIQDYELATAFEVFEHFVNPLDEINKILKFSKNILLSTQLLPDNNPKPKEWWYYALHEGQHISLYTKKSLFVIAKTFNLNFYSDGSSLHLLTERNLSEFLFDKALVDTPRPIIKTSLIQPDYLQAINISEKVASSSVLQQNHALEEKVTSHKALSKKHKQLKIILDGVFFQLYNTGIARVWKTLLKEWSESDFQQYIVVLDRAETAPRFANIPYLNIPAYSYNRTDEDRKILQQICDQEAADLFISSYYTTPLSTPSVFMAYDMIPEVLGANFNEPMWREKHRGIQHASAYLAISENTARDLVKFFPHIDPDSVTVAHCGVQDIFSPANNEDINRFKTKYGISKPYLLGVGISSGYKNSALFFKAFGQLDNRHGFEIVCTGSGALFPEEFRTYTSGVVVHMLHLSDDELKAAYSGAVALIYPSKYEGFGLPVLEAISCGCPVITCPNASIPEVAGEAALYVNDEDVNGMANALCNIQKPEVRNWLIAAGFDQAKKFSWSTMARIISSALIKATLQPLKLKDINLIIFPDWSMPEESLSWELGEVIRAVATHPDKGRMTLLIESSDISEEDANLIVSSVTINLLMQEDLEVTDEPQISLVGRMDEIQWKALLPRIHSRIVLDNDNKQTIAQVKAEKLYICSIDSLAKTLFSQ